MARKSFKNSKHLVDLIECSTLPALLLLRQVDHFECLATIDVSKDCAEARRLLIDELACLTQEKILLADREAARLLQMAGFKPEELLQHAHQIMVFEANLDLSGFDVHADVMTRLIWVRVKALKVFEKLEAMYLVHHFCGHKKFLSFAICEGQIQDFIWSQDLEHKLHEAVSQVLGLDDKARSNCEIIHFDMEEHTDGVTRRFHYLVVYHPGKMQLLRRIKDRRRDLLPFLPALEATLVYDPEHNKVHVLSDQKQVARQLAARFTHISFGKPLSREPVDAVHYELSIFKSPVDLKSPRPTGAVIEHAWVASLKASLGHTEHSISLDMENDANIWQVSDDNFGRSNPISQCRAIEEVRLSLLVRFDGEPKAQALDIWISQRGSCSLLTLRDPRMRRCGEEILLSLGVMRRVEPTAVDENIEQFLSELKLLDFMDLQINGHLLSTWNLSAPALLDKGLLKNNPPAQSITVNVAQESEPPVYCQLPVQSSSTHTWAQDTLRSRYFDLVEGDLRRYTINKAYLRERLITLLGAALQDRPLTQDEQEPYYLGCHVMGDQRLPVLLMTSLWHDGHANKMDTVLRQQNMGLGIVLTTTAQPIRRFLGSSLVIPIEALIDRATERVHLNLSRIDGELRRWRSAASDSDQPRLVKESNNAAVLYGPWPEPWFLSSSDTVAAVEVLVNAWTSGKKSCTKQQLLSDYSRGRLRKRKIKHAKPVAAVATA